MFNFNLEIFLPLYDQRVQDDLDIDLKLQYDKTAEITQKVQNTIQNRKNHMRYINEFRPKVLMTLEMQLNSDVPFGKLEPR